MVPVKALHEARGRSRATYLLWALPGKGFVESSVLYLHGRDIPLVFCMPSSIGCPLGCRICGVPRAVSTPLDTGDLMGILRYSLDSVEPLATRFQVSLMGQGEPFLNTAAVLRLCADICGNYPEATIGISTVGIASGIRQLRRQPWIRRVKLQLSLHALPQWKRRILIPSETIYPIDSAIREARYAASVSEQKCCLNYVLLRNINDGDKDARWLAEVALSGPFYVKLSTFNGHHGSPYRPSTERNSATFSKILSDAGVPVRRFTSIGTRIGVGCGQTRLGAFALDYVPEGHTSKYPGPKTLAW